MIYKSFFNLNFKNFKIYDNVFIFIVDCTTPASSCSNFVAQILQMNPLWALMHFSYVMGSIPICAVYIKNAITGTVVLIVDVVVLNASVIILGLSQYAHIGLVLK
jgi:hypothetical protein